MSDLLPVLYQKMAGLTNGYCANGQHECAQFKDLRFRCCGKKHCETAARFSKDKYGVDLPRTDNPELPFMGPNGCTVAPHFRPLCSVHVCSVSWAAHSHIGQDPEKLKEYFLLRAEIAAEAQRQDKGF
jgi:hypothetical protein